MVSGIASFQLNFKRIDLFAVPDSQWYHDSRSAGFPKSDVRATEAAEMGNCQYLTPILAVTLACGASSRTATSGPELRLDDDEGPSQGRWLKYSAELMHARWAMVLPATVTRGAVEDAWAAVAEVEAYANEWKPGSPLAEVNRNAGGAAVPVPQGLLLLLKRSVTLARETGGAFDPTWAALWGLWDFNAEPPKLPDPLAVQQRRKLVDFRRLEINEGNGTVRLAEAGMALGLGGIAKGWALHRVERALLRHGVHDFLIDCGQVLALGTRDGKPWTVGLRKPRGKPGETFATVPLHNESVSTSGDYERFFEIDGVRYHHVIDPRSGWPTRGAQAAVVVSPDPVEADALSKAALVYWQPLDELPPARTDWSCPQWVWRVHTVVDAAGRVWQGGPLQPLLPNLCVTPAAK
jgi:thiamine biosynthesis lipoprotein